MSARTRANLLRSLRQVWQQACRCEAIAWAHGLRVKASHCRQLQLEIEAEINRLEWEGQS